MPIPRVFCRVRGVACRSGMEALSIFDIRRIVETIPSIIKCETKRHRVSFRFTVHRPAGYQVDEVSGQRFGLKGIPTYPSRS